MTRDKRYQVVATFHSKEGKTMIFDSRLTHDPKYKDWTKLEAEIQSSALYHYGQLLGEKDLKLGELYIAPFRDDHSPTLALFYSREKNLIMWKDFGTGESGEVIKLFSLCRAVPYHQAILQMASPYEQEEREIATSHFLSKNKDSEVRIGVKRCEWSIDSFKYWSDFGIEPSSLQKYRIDPISEYIANGKVTFRSSFPDNPSYVYRIFNSMKIYSPLRPRNFKWRGNGSVYDIQGWEQLRNGKDLIITKSLKDVMLLDYLGFPAIAPQSETAEIPTSVLCAIEDRGYEKIHIFYDNDEAGIAGSEKIKKKYFPEANIIRIDPASGAKDVSDLYRKWGDLNAIREWVNLKT